VSDQSAIEPTSRRGLPSTLRLLRDRTQEGIEGAARRLRGSPTARLGARDQRRLTAEIDACLSPELGDVVTRVHAAEVADLYRSLDRVGRARFFAVLAEHYHIQRTAVEDAAAHYEAAAHDPEDDAAVLSAESRLRSALVPGWERLFRLFIGTEGGVKFTVDLRADLRSVISAARRAAARPGAPGKAAAGAAAPPDDAEAEATAAVGLARLIRLDADLREVLDQAFDVGLLELRRITWDSPAAFLEKLIAYEAVHEITSWADLKHRLRPDRRCFAYVHPAMPDEPLIFVEVALVDELATSIHPLLDQSAPVADTAAASWAIFYSISTCQDGLAGVRLGDFLIKRVVNELQRDLPSLKNFSTLSPIPGLRAWLERRLDEAGDELVAGLSDAARTQLVQLAGPHSDAPVDGLRHLLSTTDWLDDRARLAAAEPALTQLAARYLVTERRDGRASDRVANFHLSNGARVERIDFGANVSPVGVRESLGLMVNYRYELDKIESNHLDYVVREKIPASSAVNRQAS